MNEERSWTQSAPPANSPKLSSRFLKLKPGHRAPAVSAPVWLPGEKEEITRVDNVSQIFPNDAKVVGSLWVTNYRMIFRSADTEYPDVIRDFDIPHGSIFTVSKVKPFKMGNPQKYVEIRTRHFQKINLSFPLNSKYHKFVLEATAKLLLAPNSAHRAFCFANQESLGDGSGWFIYQATKEWKRMGFIPLEQWKITDANLEAAMCQSYPYANLTANSVVEDQLLESAKARELGQFPVPLWTSVGSTATLIRSMGLISSENYCLDDSSVIRLYGRKNTLNPLVIVVDVGPRRSLVFQDQYQCEWMYLDLPANATLADWYESIPKHVRDLGGSQWAGLPRRLIQRANELCDLLCKNRSILVQGYKKNLIHYPLISIVQVLMDPYYRTVRGFCTLIEKDWIQYSFPFATHLLKDKGSTPHFELFLNTVWILTITTPNSFEFNEELLLYLMDVFTSNRYGTFMSNTLKEINDKELQNQTPSVWGFIALQMSAFKNTEFATQGANLDNSVDNTIPWNQYFLRYDFDHAIELQKAQTTLRSEQARVSVLPAIRQLAWIPTKLLDIPGIQSITIKNNRIPILSPILRFMPFLEELILAGNPITALPIDFLAMLGRYMVRLRYLDLDRIKVGEYPGNIHRCIPSLQEFHMSEIDLTGKGVYVPLTIDEPITGNFKVLELRKNGITSLPAKFRALWTLTKLDLSGNTFPTFPVIVASLPALEELNLSSNRLVALVTGINMPNLKVLDLSQNQISQISEDFAADFRSVVILNLGFNVLKTLPESLFQKAANIEALTLSNNQLTTLPQSLGNLGKLSFLDVSNCQLEELPDSVMSLGNLKMFNTSSNKLTTLPIGFGRMKLLRSLDIRNNRMTTLPPQLGLLSESLQTFNFEGNDLVTPPVEVTMNGPRAVLEYLQDLIAGAKPCYRMKLMIVGEENVGKTTLVDALTKRWNLPAAMQGSFVEPVATLSTDGIEISTCSFTWENEGDKAVPRFKPGERVTVTVNFWDFAGQEVYYTTHQFFLSERSLFIVVYNLERPIEDSRVDYWLNSIQSKVRGASVLVVGTHIDGMRREARENLPAFIRDFKVSYRQNYPALDLAFVAISAKTGEGIQELKDLLEKRVVSAKQMGEMLPSSYLLLEKSVVEERRRVPPIVSKAKFLEMGQCCSITSETELFRASSLLHNLGTLIYFDKDTTLNQYVILEPQWLAKMMATLITTKHSFINGGILQHKALTFLWRDYPTSIYSFLLQLLEKFEVTYNLAGYAGKLKLPQVRQTVYIETSLKENEKTLKKTKSFAHRNTLTQSGSAPNLSTRGKITEYFSALQGDRTDSPNRAHTIMPDWTKEVDEETTLDVFAPQSDRGSVKFEKRNFQVAHPRGPRKTDPDLMIGGPRRRYSIEQAQIRATMSGAPTGTAVSAPVSPTSSVVSSSNTSPVSSSAPSPNVNAERQIPGFDLETYSLIPSLLSAERPEEVGRLWSQFPPTLENEINRVYRFQFLPNGFFSRLMVRLLQRFQAVDGDTTHYWKNGLLLQRGEDKILALMIPEIKTLEIFVRGGPYDRISPSFCAIIEAISLLQREWANLTCEQVVRCTHCRRAGYNHCTEFPLNQLTAAVRDKKDLLECFNSGQIAAEVIAEQQQNARAQMEQLAFMQAQMSEMIQQIQPEELDPMAQMELMMQQLNSLQTMPTNPPTPQMPGMVPLPGMASPMMNPAFAAPPPPIQPMGGTRTEVKLDQLVPDLRLVYLRGTLVRWEDLEIEKQIGRGGFAIVYKGKYQGETVAIKKLEVGKEADESAAEEQYSKAFAEFRKEAFVMTSIDDPHCVLLKGVCLDPFALITEFVPYGDLYGVVNKPEFKIDWPLRLKIAMDMAKGMQFLHSQKPPIIHNDLKTPNVLMMGLDINMPVLAKVSDFGLSMQVSKMYKRLVDNPVWLAPEIMMGQTYTTKADVYAYGVMLWELVERKQHFSHVPFNSDLEIRVMAGERAPMVADTLPEYEKLVRMCWDQDPNKRPDFTTIIRILDLLMQKFAAGKTQVGPSSEVVPQQPQTLPATHPITPSLLTPPMMPTIPALPGLAMLNRPPATSPTNGTPISPISPGNELAALQAQAVLLQQSMNLARLNAMAQMVRPDGSLSPRGGPTSPRGGPTSPRQPSPRATVAGDSSPRSLGAPPPGNSSATGSTPPVPMHTNRARVGAMQQPELKRATMTDHVTTTQPDSAPPSSPWDATAAMSSPPVSPRGEPAPSLPTALPKMPSGLVLRPSSGPRPDFIQLPPQLPTEPPMPEPEPQPEPEPEPEPETPYIPPWKLLQQQKEEQQRTSLLNEPDTFVDAGPGLIAQRRAAERLAREQSAKEQADAERQRLQQQQQQQQQQQSERPVSELERQMALQQQLLQQALVGRGSVPNSPNLPARSSSPNSPLSQSPARSNPPSRRDQATHHKSAAFKMSKLAILECFPAMENATKQAVMKMYDVLKLYKGEVSRSGPDHVTQAVQDVVAHIRTLRSSSNTAFSFIPGDPITATRQQEGSQMSRAVVETILAMCKAARELDIALLQGEYSDVTVETLSTQSAQMAAAIKPFFMFVKVFKDEVSLLDGEEFEVPQV